MTGNKWSGDILQICGIIMAVMALFTCCVVLVLLPSTTPSLIFPSAMRYVRAACALGEPPKSQLLDCSTAERQALAMPWMAVKTFCLS